MNKYNHCKKLIFLRLIVVVALLFSIPLMAMAQVKKLTGVVTDETGETLVGVLVQVPKTTIGVANDLGRIVRNFSGALLSTLAAKRTLNDGITFFLLPFRLTSLFGRSDGIGGAAKSVIVTKLMLDNLADDRATAIHEGSHSLGLYHSFKDGMSDLIEFVEPENLRKTVYSKFRTENVMDYSPIARSLKKWQWAKIQNDHPDVKLKP